MTDGEDDKIFSSDVVGNLCDSYLDNDGLNPVDAAQVHGDVSEGLGLPAPAQRRVESDIENNIHDKVLEGNGLIWRCRVTLYL